MFVQLFFLAQEFFLLAQEIFFLPQEVCSYSTNIFLARECFLFSSIYIGGNEDKTIYFSNCLWIVYQRSKKQKQTQQTTKICLKMSYETIITQKLIQQVFVIF